MLRGFLPLRLPARALRAPMALAAALAAGGCHYAGSPFDGFGTFIGDTHTFNRNPTRPPGADENMLRAEGHDVTEQPLLPEGGNVWPGPAPAEPTLSDVLRQQNQEQDNLEKTLPNPATTPSQTQTPPRRRSKGSSTPPPPQPSVEVPNPPPPANEIPATPPITVPPAAIPSPSGPLIPSGPNTVTTPGGGTSIVVPNGNGTSTVINPDGTTQTIITPRR